MDFGLVPPEIQSALMYAGPGPGPITATAAAWDGLAADLDAASASYTSLITDLTSTGWLGGASEVMAAAVMPYVVWMKVTAVQAAETAAHVRAGVAAYEAAFAATVPPPAIAANRTELITLIATNIFGQNSAAIAANQAVYAEMWAQDSAAMYGYAAAASTATQLTSFTPPPEVADSNGSDQTAAAAAQATEAGQNAAQQGMQTVPQMLQQLALPAQAGTADAVVDGVVGDATAATAASGLSLGSAYHGAIGSVNFFQRLASQFYGQFSTSSAPTTTDIMERVNRIGLVTGAIDPNELEEGAVGGGLGKFGDWHNWLHWLRQLGSSAGKAFLSSAHTGQASMAGALSVPPAWTAVPPELQLAALEVPGAAADAAPTGSDGPGGGVGNLFAGTAAAGMAARALTNGRETAAGRDRVKAPKQSQLEASTVSELRERAELLREFGDLRDAGLLSDAEFHEQKRLLMNPGNQHRGL